LGDDLLYARAACSALVITCSDFRFKSVERTFVEMAGLVDDYDLIARPGAIRSLVSPRNTAARDSMEEEILMLWKLHRFTRVLMMNHLSCRAYDDLAAGADERSVHLAHLQAAGPAIERRYEGVTAEAYLVAIVDGVLRVEKVSSSQRR
jgi:Putative carbonic anhydrase